MTPTKPPEVCPRSETLHSRKYDDCGQCHDCIRQDEREKILAEIRRDGNVYDNAYEQGAKDEREKIMLEIFGRNEKITGNAFDRVGLKLLLANEKQKLLVEVGAKVEEIRKEIVRKSTIKNAIMYVEAILVLNELKAKLKELEKR
jgi:hypothetical protein